MLYEIPTEFSIEIGPLGLDYGRFLFEAPPFEEEFNYPKEADPNEIISTCWGFLRNVEGVDDYFGIGIMDRDTKELIRGYYTDIKLPIYEFASWYARQDQIMPARDWNLICYIGYYRIEENVLHATDWIEFTIKSTAVPKPFPVWLLFVPLLLIPAIGKLK